MTPTKALENAIQTLRMYADPEQWDELHRSQPLVNAVFCGVEKAGDHGYEPAAKALDDLNEAMLEWPKGTFPGTAAEEEAWKNSSVIDP